MFNCERVETVVNHKFTRDSFDAIDFVTVETAIREL